MPQSLEKDKIFKYLSILNRYMAWSTKIFAELKKKFGKKIFYAADAVKELDYSATLVYNALSVLAKSGKLEKAGRGIYKIKKGEETHIKPALAGGMEGCRKSLLNKVSFMITGPSVLISYVHLLPRRMLHLIYVLRGSGEYAADILSKKDKKALLNPDLGEINTALSLTGIEDIIILREVSDLYGSKDGVASIERALVDLYFESTRREMPFSTAETGQIIFNALRHAGVDISKLGKCASKRGIRKEFNTIMAAMLPDVPAKISKNRKENKYTKEVATVLGTMMR